MKCKLIRYDCVTPNPAWSAKKAMQAKVKGRAYSVPKTLPLKFGTVVDHPDAYLLVQMGQAIPEDEACRQAAGLTPEQMAHVQKRYELFSKGMLYDEDGNEVEFDDVELEEDNADDGENAGDP